MEKNEQLEICKFINELLKTKFNGSFRILTQGGDTAQTMVITSGNIKVIGRINNYLVNSLDLIVKDGTKGHGNGGNFTRLINLSEIDPKTIGQIKRKFDLITKKQQKKEKMILSEKSSKPIISTIPVPENILPVTETIPDVVKIEKDHDLKSFTTSVSWMVRSEGIQAGSFSCDKIEPGKYCVYCKNPEIASKVYSFLVWRAGDPSLVEIDKDIVMIDYVNRRKKAKELEKINFCLPPAETADSDEVKRRLIKISPGSRPIVSLFDDGKFLIKYVRSNFVIRIFPILLSMGWPVEMKDENLFIVSVADSEELVSSVSEQTLPDNNEEVKIAATDRDKFDLSIPQNRSNLLFGVKTKEEALIEIMKLYDDSVLFNELSPETQQRIIAVVKEEARKNNPEQFAKNLLSIIGK